NFGNIRRLGEEVYAANLYKLPAILAFVLEVQPEHIQQFTEPADTWQAPTEERPLQAPAQGFREKGSSALADESVVRWLASEVHDRCCIMARAARVKSMRTVKKWRTEDRAGQYSRLLQVEVIWHAPISGQDRIEVAVGHLHNETAKKDNNERRRFFDAVAECCAGGARILGMDLNMALFGLVPEMAKRHVGVTLISHHYEWRPNGTWLYDSLGLWVVGPMNLKKSTILSPRCHALAGAYHPVLMDRANPRGNRGYKANAFV
ncbi:MAG: hypothetical protein GY772_26075, partial [bacterium]|nr:hypothetical protein [bacterium]